MRRVGVAGRAAPRPCPGRPGRTMAPSRANSCCCSAVSRSWLQSSVARSVRCRSGRSRGPGGEQTQLAVQPIQQRLRVEQARCGPPPAPGPAAARPAAGRSRRRDRPSLVGELQVRTHLARPGDEQLPRPVRSARQPPIGTASPLAAGSASDPSAYSRSAADPQRGPAGRQHGQAGGALQQVRDARAPRPGPARSCPAPAAPGCGPATPPPTAPAARPATGRPPAPRRRRRGPARGRRHRPAGRSRARPGTGRPAALRPRGMRLVLPMPPGPVIVTRRAAAQCGGRPLRSRPARPMTGWPVPGA